MNIKLIRYNMSTDIYIPKRAYDIDTGADIAMIEGGTIQPHETKVIPLGFGIELFPGYNANIQVRTSWAKKGLMVHQCAIDPGYIGELHLIMTNLSTEPIHWKAGERLAYLQLFSIIYANFIPGELDDYCISRSDTRGTNAFGSTDNKYPIYNDDSSIY